MANASKHGGPRTAQGKHRSKSNARIHCLLTAELFVSTDERRNFEHLKSDLTELLRPSTPLLELLLDDVVACAWRMKMALRCEQRAVKKQLNADAGDDSTTRSDKPRDLDFPYPATPLELRPRLKFLDDVLAAFRRNSFLSPEIEEPMTQAFGPTFWETLTKWNPADTMLMQLLACSLEKQQAFGMKPDVDPPSPEQERRFRQLDTEARVQMVIKLMELKKDELLLALHRTGETKAGAPLPDATTDRLDLFMRYQTTARREFHRALHEYRETKARPAILG